MNIQKKIKLIDSVFFIDDIDYLLFRFTELNNSVDAFIILEPLVDFFGNKRLSFFEKNIDKFKMWENKIIHIKSNFPSENELNIIFENHPSLGNIISEKKFNDILKIKQIYDLNTKLHSLNLNFDDIILLSKIDEFPIVPPIEILQTYLSFDPLFFSQKDFIWTKDFINTKNHLGTLCLSYSQIITTDSIFLLSLTKRTKNLLGISSINCGYKFSYFNSIEETLDKIIRNGNTNDVFKLKNDIIKSRDELLYIDFENNQESTPLKEYFGELPENINMLDSQKIGRIIPKKHLVIVGIDASRELSTDDFESVSIITHTTNLSTKEYRDITDNIKIHYILIPTQKYYDVFVNENTLENFQKMYFLNEIKKILILHYPLDIDIFEFYVGGRLLSYTWSQIKNEFIYDLLEN